MSPEQIEELDGWVLALTRFTVSSRKALTRIIQQRLAKAEPPEDDGPGRATANASTWRGRDGPASRPANRPPSRKAPTTKRHSPTSARHL
jgi:hypothetical protein